MDLQQFQRFLSGNAKAAAFWPALSKTFDVAAIITRDRVAHFLAQTAHESAGYTVLTENLNYSAQGLRATFPKYFDGAAAIEYQRLPERIANRVYAGRMGNGPETSGDGWRFRGRGLIQLTGRDNYRDAGADLGLRLLEHPDDAARPDVAPLIAGWFWSTRQLNKLADVDDIEGITRRINGGLNGLDDRKRWLVLARKVLA